MERPIECTYCRNSRMPKEAGHYVYYEAYWCPEGRTEERRSRIFKGHGCPGCQLERAIFAPGYFLPDRSRGWFYYSVVKPYEYTPQSIENDVRTTISGSERGAGRKKPLKDFFFPD